MTDSRAETTAWLQLKKSTDIPVSQIATYRAVPLTGKGGRFNTGFLAEQSPIQSSVPPCIGKDISASPRYVQKC